VLLAWTAYETDVLKLWLDLISDVQLMVCFRHYQDTYNALAEGEIES
jgi:hypothetical protein